MREDEIKEMEKKVSKARFNLSQKAGELHDLIEDRLPGDYTEIPQYAEAAYRACMEWDKLNKELNKIKRQ